MPSRKQNVQKGTREDLKAVYLAVFDSAITTDVPSVASKLRLERRYANELFQTLAAIKDSNGNALITINLLAGEEMNDTPHDWWEAGVNIDAQTHDEAEALFDATVPDMEGDPVSRQGNSAPYNPEAGTNVTTAPRTPRNATNPADLPLCLCGCQTPVNNRKRNYKPGHDARHAGQVARAMAAWPGLEYSDKRAGFLDVLPTDALRWKAATMADRLIAKETKGDRAVKHASKAQIEAAITAGEKAKAKSEVGKVEFASGKVKIGRWTYPAEQNVVSGAVTFIKKGKTEVASEKVAASFTEGN